jgi:hypothetical protein
MSSSFVKHHLPGEIYTGPEIPVYHEFKYPLDHFQAWGCRAIEDEDYRLYSCKLHETDTSSAKIYSS